MLRRSLLALLLLAAPAWAGGVHDSQVTCTSGGGVLVGTSTGRISLCLFNTDAAVTAYFGPTGAATEFALSAGTGICIDASTGQGYGFTAENTIKCEGNAASVVLSVHEGYR